MNYVMTSRRDVAGMMVSKGNHSPIALTYVYKLFQTSVFLISQIIMHIYIYHYTYVDINMYCSVC